MNNRKIDFRDLDTNQYPPFEGFPLKGLQFLRSLKRNNNREWFARHKLEYEELVKFPMQCLIYSLQPVFEEIAPEFEASPQKSIFRIYRDIRFSHDKSPYKTHAAAHFVVRGKPRGIEGSGYYLHVEPGEVYLGGGLYMPDSDQLKSIRKTIAENSDVFLSILNDKIFLRTFGKMEGATLSRVPKGYDPNHPMAGWLKFKQFFVGYSLPEEACYNKSFSKKIERCFSAVTPLVRFLNDACGAKQ